MNQVTREKLEFLKDIFAVLLIILLFILSSLFIKQNLNLVSNAISKSFLGVLVYIIILAISIIFAPVSAIPLMPIAAAVWGWIFAAILAVIGWTLGSVIAFTIAKKYGKPLVQKLISLKRLEKTEKLIPEGNIFFLVVFLTAIMPLDGLSYVLGLFTKIRIKTYALATFIGLIPFCFIFSYLGTLPIIYQLIGFTLAVIVLMLMLIHLDNKQRKKQKTN